MIRKEFNMIKERYCSSEVSRLLREKGFDEAKEITKEITKL